MYFLFFSFPLFVAKKCKYRLFSNIRKETEFTGAKKADGIRQEGKEGFKAKLSYTMDHWKEYGFNMKSDGKPAEGLEKKAQI